MTVEVETPVGIVIPNVYDGVSVWQFKDGTMQNRWLEPVQKFPDDAVIRRRYQATAEWIIRQAMLPQAGDEG